MLFVKIKFKSKALNGSDSNYPESSMRMLQFVETKMTIIF